MKITILIQLCLCVSLCQTRLFNWASLDHASDEIKQKASHFKMGAGSASGLDDDEIDPDPNSPISVRGRIKLTYRDENDIWLGDIDGASVVIPTFTYLKSMSQLTSVTGNFIRKVYSEVYGELELYSCNSLNTPPELILDSNLGFGPNKILLNVTDLSYLIPPHSCRLPFLPQGPGFSVLRKFMPQYRAFLRELDQFLECILLYNAFPSYTKGVNCIEDYYYGSQDASANPPFFDLMATKQDLKNSVENFYASPEPADVTLISSTTWTELQYELDIARQYKEIARKVRATAQLIYTAITRNYARLVRADRCRRLASQFYFESQNAPKFWCGYRSCFSSNFRFSVRGIVTTQPPSMSPSYTEKCQERPCGFFENFPDPFYCDSTRICPDSMYCSLPERKCYTKEKKSDFSSAFNKTICGYPKKLADASIMQGSIDTAFSGAANESSFSFKTFWPEKCNTVTTLETDYTRFEDLGPDTFDQICYPFLPNVNSSFFFNSTTFNCSMLGNSTEFFEDVTFLYYLDGQAVDYVTKNFTVIRKGKAEPWQLEHCKATGIAPVQFGNMNATYIPCLNCDPEPLYPDPDSYMRCNDTTSCVTQNRTHACYNNVQDLLRVYNYNITKTETECRDARIYKTENNVTQNYVDPYANIPSPEVQAIPSGYDSMGYFFINGSDFASLSGSYTKHPISANIPPSNLSTLEYTEFYGFYFAQAPNNYKLCGRVNFKTASGVQYAEGKDMFVTFSGVITPFPLPTLSVSNTTGQVFYNPVEHEHPNPRFNDPNECYFLQSNISFNVPMIKAPPAQRTQYKDFWMNNVGPNPVADNVVPELYPCAAIFIRKILYVQNSAWLEKGSTDYEEGVASGDLRYVCERSLQMPAQCSRFGAQLRASDYVDILTTINPPSDSIVFQI